MNSRGSPLNIGPACRRYRLRESSLDWRRRFLKWFFIS